MHYEFLQGILKGESSLIEFSLLEQKYFKAKMNKQN